MILDLYAAACSLAIGLCASACVMSRRVRDGIIVKLGLVCLALAHLVLAVLYLQVESVPLAYRAAGSLAHTGLLLMLVGYLFVRKRSGGQCRRRTDWVDLEAGR